MSSVHDLPQATPESQGIRSSAILAFLQAVNQQAHDLHSFMLLRHGRRIAEGWWAPYRAADPHMLFSLSKSFTSTAIGLAIAEGRLSVSDPVMSFFPDDAPADVSPYLRAMQVRHLLTMTTGQAAEAFGVIRTAETNWVRAFLRTPVCHEPGSCFLYNSGATYMLSAILRHVTGTGLLEYLQPRLLGPLGISGATWETCPRGIEVGGWGLRITTADIARFGQLYLQKGLWKGRQLVPVEWVAQATKAQYAASQGGSPEWQQGYGYQFWRCRYGTYRGDGAFGQYCLVLPDQDAVIAITAGLGDMQRPLDLIWQHLLPAFGKAALPANPAGHAALADALTRLTLEPVGGPLSNATAEKVHGKCYSLTDPKGQAISVRFNFAGDGTTVKVRHDAHEFTWVCGHGNWIQGSADWDGAPRSPCAASAAWLDENTWQAKLYYDQTPFLLTITCRFNGAQLTMERRWNVSFGPVELPLLVGQAGSN